MEQRRQLGTTDLENLTFSVESHTDFKFRSHMISSGSFGSVFKGKDLRNGRKVAMKQFRIEMPKWMINKEILCLQKLESGPNIIKLLAIIIHPSSVYPSLVFEYVSTDFEDCYLDFNELQTSYYLKELLKALDFCHSEGIMHRDVKPGNIVVDRERQILRLIDFGASDFYFPGCNYRNTGTEVYQPPEALLEWDIGYSVDLWSFGVILAEMQFRKSPFFSRPAMADILKVLGNTKWSHYVSGNTEANEVEDHIPFEKFIPKDGTVSTKAIDLIKNLLVYNPSGRLTASEAMAHEYFV